MVQASKPLKNNKKHHNGKNGTFKVHMKCDGIQCHLDWENHNECRLFLRFNQSKLYSFFMLSLPCSIQNFVDYISKS